MNGKAEAVMNSHVTWNFHFDDNRVKMENQTLWVNRWNE